MEAGLTLQQLANQANVSRPTVEKAESGVNISYAYAARIVRALNELAGTSYTIDSLNIAASR
jgi:predicted transcriptional regulator